jgi:hypothetical protein
MMLRDLKISVYVDVVDEKGPISSVDGGHGAARAIAVPAGFPPIGYYVFNYDEPGSVLLTLGPTYIHYTRRLAKPGEIMQMSLEDEANWMEDSSERVDFLRHMLVVGNDLKSFYAKVLVWKDSNAYENEVIALVETINHAYEAYLNGLQVQEVLTPAEANNLRPNIVLEVRDARRKQSLRLPKVTGKNLTVIQKDGEVKRK